LENSAKKKNDSIGIAVGGNITFTLQLTLHDYTYANDIFRGSFTKNLDFSSSPWLVFHNPTNTQTLFIQFYFTFRTILFWILLIASFTLSLFILCWVQSTSSQSVQKRLPRENKKLYPGISYNTHIFRKKRPQIHTSPPSDEQLESIEIPSATNLTSVVTDIV